MSNNFFYNWCTCSPTVTTTTCPNTGTCVKAPHMLINVDDSVYPCGENGVIPIADHIILPTGVDASTATYTIVSNSINLTNVTIDQNNINFTSNYDSAIEGSSFSTAEIKYRVRSGSLSDTGTIAIIFKSYCIGNTCVEGTEYCDPCTGNCLPAVVDISVTGSTGTSVDIQIT